MAKKNHNVDQCLDSLYRKNIRTKKELKPTQLVIDNSSQLGNGTWGRIDFLRKKGYSFIDERY